MKKLILTILFFSLSVSANAGDQQLEHYIANFDYTARKDMKMDSMGLIKLLKQDKAQLIDIRFKEEYIAWKVGPSLNIPINELPDRLNELKLDKIIVTACPHKDRAIVAMAYLRSMGIKAKYLTDGLIGLAENLRGDAAFDFVSRLKTVR